MFSFNLEQISKMVGVYFCTQTFVNTILWTFGVNSNTCKLIIVVHLTPVLSWYIRRWLNWTGLDIGSRTNFISIMHVLYIVTSVYVIFWHFPIKTINIPSYKRLTKLWGFVFKNANMWVCMLLWIWLTFVVAYNRVTGLSRYLSSCCVSKLWRLITNVV